MHSPPLQFPAELQPQNAGTLENTDSLFPNENNFDVSCYFRTIRIK